MQEEIIPVSSVMIGREPDGAAPDQHHFPQGADLSANYGEKMFVSDLAGSRIGYHQSIEVLPDETPVANSGTSAPLYLENTSDQWNIHWGQERISRKHLDLYYTFFHQSRPLYFQINFSI